MQVTNLWALKTKAPEHAPIITTEQTRPPPPHNIPIRTRPVTHQNVAKMTTIWDQALIIRKGRRQKKV